MTDQEKCELVAREFQALLAKHELAGFFVASAPTHATHALTLDTAPWMRLRIVEEKGAMIGIRILSKLEEYTEQGLEESDAKLRQSQEIGYTVNMLDALSSQCGPVAILSVQLLDALRTRFDIETTSTRVGDAGG